jgi:hydrogenase-4 component B
MQYTGSSFSADFSARFRSVMTMLRRQKAPTGYFPDESYLITDCVDAVERRIFSVINHGDASAGELSDRLHEDDPRVAFAVALLGIVVIAAVLVLTSGPLP